MTTEREDGVFVLGMSCRVGTANNIEKYWKNLQTGVDMVGQSEPRWPNKIYDLPEGLSVLQHINEFDSEYFDFSSKEANEMDPQIRLLLEVATEAVLDSGVAPFDLSNSTCGVFTSVYKSEVQSLNYPIEHCSTAMHAAKLSSFFNLNGPSMCVDSACSSSLVATNLAFDYLKSNKIQYALVTATSLLLSPNQSLQNFRLGMTSETGKCHTWDETADGYVRAEGIFAILLARGSDHPRLYVEIIAGANNSDGYTPEGIIFPNSGALLSLFEEIYCKVPLSDLVYLECHAPGTQAGDVAETNAICAILKKKKVTRPLLIGSVKPNLGHAEWAAGLASFIKAVLCISRKQIPPNLNLENLNPNITGITVGTLIPVTDLLTLPDGLVGVTAMGFGGSNCHLVLKSVETSRLFAPNNLLLLTASRTNVGLKMQDSVLSTIYDPKYISFISQAFTSSLCASMLHRRSAIVSGFDNVYAHDEFLADSCIGNVRTTDDVFIVVHDIGMVGDLDDFYLPSMGFDDNPLNCPMFRRCLQRIEDIYLKYGTPGKRSSCRVHSFNDVLSCSASYILTILSIITEVGMTIEGCIGAGLSDLIAGSIDGCIHPYNVLSLLKIIATILRAEGTENNDRRNALEVDETGIELQILFGLNIRILSNNSFRSTTISFQSDYEHTILSTLNEKEISYRPIELAHPRLYTEKLRNVEKQFVGIVNKKLITGEKEQSIRSKTWFNIHGHIEEQFNSQPISPRYIGQIIRHSTLLTHAIVKIPKTSTQVHIGMRSKPVWVPEDVIYIDATSYLSILQAFGLLYLKGFNVNPNELNATSQVTGTCPNIGQLVQWDHSVECAVPHWLQFSATVKQEEIKDCFKLQCSGSLSSFLCEILMRIVVTFCQTDDAVELYNLDLYPDRLSNIKDDDNVFLHVTEASKSFKAFDGSNVLARGNYKTEIVTYTNTSVNKLLQVDGKRSGPIVLEVTWRGDVLECLELVIEKLQQMTNAHDRRLSIQSFGLKFSSLPRRNRKNTQISFTAELTSGLCHGNGIFLKMSPIWICDTLFLRTSSDLHIPLVALDLSDIVRQEDSPVEIHMMRLYQLQDAFEHNPSLILVYCTSNVTHIHNIGISLITKSKITLLLNLQLPKIVSCQYAVGVVIPYLLALFVAEKMSTEAENVIIDELAVFSAQSDFLLTSILFLTQTIARNIFAIIQNDKHKDVFKDTSSSSKMTVDVITDSTVDSFLAESEISDLHHDTSTASKDSESEQSMYLSDNDVSRTDSPISEASRNSHHIVELLFPQVIVLSYNEASSLQIQKYATNMKIRNIISLHPDLPKSCAALSSGGTLIHMGGVDAENLGIGICAQYGAIQTLNPMFSLTQILDNINDLSFPTEDEDCNSDHWANMWTLYLQTTDIAPFDAENNNAYRSTATIPTVIPIGLNVVQEKLQTKLKEDASSANIFKNLEWMGKFHSLARSSRLKRITRLFESSQYPPDASTPFNLRLKSASPVVHSLPQNESEGKSRVHFDLSDEEMSSPHFLPIAAPLSRPCQPVLVKMNKVTEGSPIFFIHPVTGVLNLLKNLATELPVPCYGLQQTSTAPANSLLNLANFYLEICRGIVKDEPLRLIGFSYGACIAYVMAVEGQRSGVDVSHLIMLDGSPDYVKVPLVKIRESYGIAEVQSVLDTEELLAFLQIYGNVAVNSIRAELMNCADRNERVNVAVNYLTTCDSPRTQSQNRWKWASRRLSDAPDPRLLATANQVLLSQRIERANAFLANMDLVDFWIASDEKFKGDVYLFRIEDPPLHCPDLPDDYGLRNLVIGKVRIKKYKETHESLVGPTNVLQLALDVMALFL
uniref:Fatty acid synthase n=1 Tax=Strigamia maritima TaxID=126957 RepID=T1IZ10_STRMM